ncbi:MAG: hypothetical protein WCD52_15705 [Xanthobacteraceae bacterium]
MGPAPSFGFRVGSARVRRTSILPPGHESFCGIGTSNGSSSMGRGVP